MMSEQEQNQEPSERLAFEQVSFTSAIQNVADLREVSLALYQGEALAILNRHREHGLPLCDLAQGLCDADEGSVRSLGESWDNIGPADAAGLRGRMGRVFSGPGWISNLSVYENVTLRLRHSTRQSDDEIAEELETMAGRVGLDNISPARPEAVLPSVLRLSSWVRAFSGRPDLVLLEHPEEGVPPERIQDLVGLAEDALKRGAALVWITRQVTVWQELNLPGLKRLRFRDGLLTEK